MKLSKYEQWILDHKNDSEALEKRISRLFDRRQTTMFLACVKSGIAAVLATLSILSGGESMYMALGAYCLGVSVIGFVGVYGCSSEIRTLAILHSECSGGDRELPQQVAEPAAG